MRREPDYICGRETRECPDVLSRLAVIMKKFLSIVVLLSMYVIRLHSQEVDNILVITGFSDAEQLTEQILERFEVLASRPLEINMSSVRKLSDSGLFSRYQAASIEDYRKACGDILSVAELAAVDGIGEELAQALGPYVTFSSASLPGSVPADRTRQSAVAGASLKNGKAVLRGKYRLSSGFFESGAALKYDGAADGTVYIQAEGTRYLDRLIVGDFNVRFGQGMAFWTGMSVTGFGAPSTFYKRQHGFSPAWSYSDMNLRGVAASLSCRRLNFCAFAASPWLRKLFADRPPDRREMLAGGSLAWFSRYGQAGVTASVKTMKWTRLSADARFCLGGIELFSEVAAEFPLTVSVPGGISAKSSSAINYVQYGIVGDGGATKDANGGNGQSLAGIGALAGMVLPVGKGIFSVVARYYPEGFSGEYSAPVRAWTKASDEAGAALAFQRGRLSVSCDFAVKPSTKSADERKAQIKIVAADVWDLSPSFSVKARISQRFRSYGLLNKSDARVDTHWENGTFVLNTRMNMVFSRDCGALAYIEPGWKRENGYMYLRLTAFAADSWDDRVYCYERDIPGSFTVPAYYGRGFSSNLICTRKWRLGRSSLKMYLCGGCTVYPWPGHKKPGTYSFRGQLAYDF